MTSAPPLPHPPAGGTSTSPAADAVRDVPAPRRRTRIFALPEARWAAAALALFLAALPLHLLGAPAWAWGPLYAAAYVTGGWEPGRAGLQALRGRTLDVDLLMVVAAIGAAAIGQVLDGALLIVIFATSGALEAIATARTADSVRGLLDLAPATATRITDDGGEETVPGATLKAGDTILVRPGERVGADGRVLDGASEVDQATITGEPLPVAKEAGDEVFAGTLNGTGALRVKVERDPSDSVIARIVAMVEEASRTKAPTQLFVEKIEQRYSIGMVAATIALFALPLLLGAALQPTLLRAMTFMIVASPCAVVLATMPPLLSAIANAGRHGVLVKSAVVMERLGQVDRAALDKTGTLTEGTPRVTDIRPLPASGMDENALLTLAAAAEHPSEHPLACAIVDGARTRGLAVPPVTGFASAPGTGVTATVGGRAVAVGSPARLLGGRDDHPAAAAAAELEREGRTAVLVGVDGTPVGVLGIADRLRADAAATVTALSALTGSAPVLVTGDNPRAAARLAERSASTTSVPDSCPRTRSPPCGRWNRRAGRCWWSATASTTPPPWPPPTPASPWAAPVPTSPWRPPTPLSSATNWPPSPPSSASRAGLADWWCRTWSSPEPSSPAWWSGTSSALCPCPSASPDTRAPP
ncbi:heavy metal translocating P-type ATPase [Streptomyces luteireticuli]|uniref:Heavy metal translocating P-type ATPase n=1 Tax=Streptomyces luteireticuli TaxID=173858 RepID=A0ABN0YX74_9ACTN